MKLTLKNNFCFIKRLVCVAGLSFFGVMGWAQDTPAADTAVESGQDSTTIVDPGTASDHPNYFERKTAEGFDTLVIRQVPGSVVDSLKKHDAFWYADHVFKKKEKEELQKKEIKTPARWMNMAMLVVIVAIFLGLLAWYLVQNNIITRTKKIPVERIEEEISEENLFDINYRREIEKAVNAANYRLAIRLMFLRLLKELSQRKIIQYKQERTNFDYLAQLHSTSYYRDFFRLTRNYEYAWYGKFDVSPEAFGTIKNDFESFDKRLS